MDPMIRISGLRKDFGGLTAVDCLSFNILRDEIFGLLGPNGAGKTTTISMICGLLPATDGKISINGHTGHDRKAMIGYCPQENIFYPKLTCLEQLVFIGQMYGLSGEEGRLRGTDLLGQLGLGAKSAVLAGKLSGGMKRRLNICLALIHDPEILVLDEPEAGLDPQSRIMVRDFIKNFSRGRTVILTTHNMDEADRLADRVAIIDHGSLLMLDTPHNLKKTVGEGALLEMVMESSSDVIINAFSERMKFPGMTTVVSGSSVFIRHPDILGQLPDIKRIAGECGLGISEIKLRENTLEDVFIHLTGRSLRQ